jgi:hypothetical protein
MRFRPRIYPKQLPEQQEAKWVVLKNALATRKTADAPKVANSGAPRDGSKISLVIAMLKREGGTTLEEKTGATPTSASRTPGAAGDDSFREIPRVRCRPFNVTDCG